MRIIDDYLSDLLHANDNEWLKKIVRHGKIKIEPSGFIGNRRNADILVTILNYHGNKTQDIAIEIENDRKFDVDEILQKIKKDQPCPSIVIIPKEHKKSAWRFQENLIIVWFWNVKCRWKCEGCNAIFTTTSSITPNKCKGETCNKGSNFLHFDGVEPNNKPFTEADNNPSMTFAEIQDKLRPRGFFLSVR